MKHKLRIDTPARLSHIPAMLRIQDLSYSIDGRALFDGASATIPGGHKVGLVGRNGAGKTTLFRLIRNELTLDGGTIDLPARARIGGGAIGCATSAARRWRCAAARRGAQSAEGRKKKDKKKR